MAASVPVQRAAPRYVSLPGHALALSGLAMTAGVIHVVATLQHLDVTWTLPAFFALVGTGQLCAARSIYRKPDDRRMLKAVAAGSVVVALLWVFSRTTGIPFGPEPGVAKVGVADTIATLHELAFAAIVVALLRRPGAGERRLAWLSSALGIRLTSAILSVTLLLAAAGGHEH